MTSRDEDAGRRTQEYAKRTRDKMLSVISEMKDRGAVLTHIGIMYLVCLPPALGPRLGIRALSRHSESYFTYALGTSREPRKNHPMAHLYVGDEDEPDYLPTNTHDPFRDQLSRESTDPWITEEEMTMTSSQRRVSRENQGRRLQALQNLEQLPTPTEREEWLLVIYDRYLTSKRARGQTATAVTYRKGYMVREGVAERVSETRAAWVATDHGKALEQEAHDCNNAITKEARVTGRDWSKSPWANPSEDHLDEIALADYLKWVKNTTKAAKKSNGATATATELREASGKTLQQFKADKVAEFRAIRVAEVKATAASAATAAPFFKKARLV